MQSQELTLESRSISANKIKTIKETELAQMLPLPEHGLAVLSNFAVIQTLRLQIKQLEKAIKSRVQLKEEFKQLLTISGIGNVLGVTIMLETGDIHRFSKVGNFSSYCRCVDSRKTSNGKKKGVGNTKNGNKFLAWAFVEAANAAVRYNPRIKRFYQRKKAKTNGVIAIKAVAHKLARAAYHVMRDKVPFDELKAFG